mmetsp:Transcript_22885/g.50240  ORF Transcript_22885/g.50240 Transcript_22885/m.50240 type:complete len:206 (-) Transcript_22885:1173-1790(-)
MAPPTGWSQCCVCSMKPRVLSSRVVARGRGLSLCIWSLGMQTYLISWIFARTMAKRSSGLGIYSMASGSRTSSCNASRRMGSGLYSVPRKPLDCKMQWAKSLSDCTNSMRRRERGVRLCLRKLYGSGSWNPRSRLAPPICCTRMHAMRNRTRKTWGLSGARICAPRSYSLLPLMRSQSATWRQLRCLLSSPVANLSLNALHMWCA